MMTETSGHRLLDTDALKTFVAVCDTGSVSRASEQIHRTPSAVSMQIRRLEEVISRPLFVKRGRGIRMTDDATLLLGYARQMLRLNNEALAQFHAPVLEGKVRFGTPDDFGSRFLPDLLARFYQTHPNVEVDVVLNASNELNQRLRSGEVDLALTTTSPNDATLAKGEGDILLTEPLVWAGLKGGLAHTRDPLPLALAKQGCAWRTEALESLSRAERPYRVCYSSENAQGQLAAVRADLAVAAVPRGLLSDPFIMLGPEAGLPELGLYQMVLYRAKAAGEASKALADHISTTLHEHPNLVQ